MRKILILLICLMLITGIFFGAVSLSNLLTGKESGPEKDGVSESPSAKDRITETVSGTGFTEAVFETDASGGQIGRILVCILSKDGSCLDIIEIDTGVSYTMTQKLYTELTPEKVTLPQTVRFSELYTYYGDGRAYEAGLKIIGEMLGLKLERCAVFDTGGFDEEFYKKVRECTGAGTVYHELPVIRHNETILPDTEDIENMMYDVLYLD